MAWDSWRSEGCVTLWPQGRLRKGRSVSLAGEEAFEESFGEGR